jgi:beta-lactamase superfamily II metal-dependent hydrolase
MAWELEISTIDVAQGESSLVVARDAGGPGGARVMIIDGGRQSWGPVVHRYVRGRLAALGLARVDHLLVTHYDADHVGGVESLLNSDNLWALCTVLGNAAALAWTVANNVGAPAGDCVAAAAAAAAAASRGGYNIPGGNQYASLAHDAGLDAQLLRNPTPKDGASLGREYANDRPHNPVLLVSTVTVEGTAVRTAIAAAAAAGVPGPAIRAAYRKLKTQIPSPVRTEGLYRSIHLIDIGDTTHVPDEYEPLIDGRVYFTNGNQAEPPGTNRTRTSVAPADNGDELLWHSGPNTMAAPANSPAAFMVANNKWIWLDPGNHCPINSNEPENDDSIALVIRFGNFFFYTGGDLPWQGENLIADAVMGTGLPNPQGGPAFPVPNRIPAFKCGHHGSEKSTSAYFLGQIDPDAAFISCGFNGFGRGDQHPTQVLIDRLQAYMNLTNFYLTNCKYVTNYIPASNGADQLSDVNNRSRICGDNADDNLDRQRVRGTSRLYLNQAESIAGGGPFHVYYDDHDANLLAPPVNGHPPPVGPTTNNHPY